MKYPYLRPRARRRCRIGRFLGYDCRPDAPQGAFCGMENGSAAAAPLLRVRPRRTPTSALDACPTDDVYAIGGGDRTAVLDGAGTLWCGGHALPRFLAVRVHALAETEADGRLAPIVDEEAVLAACPEDGTFRFSYDRDDERWVRVDRAVSFPAAALSPQTQPDEGDRLSVTVTSSLQNRAIRSMVFLGGFACVFPDGRFADTLRLARGETMTEGEDYGEIAQSNTAFSGTFRFEPCGPDGTVRALTVAAAAPTDGFWIDPTEETPTVRALSRSSGTWEETAPFVRCSLPGIAKGLRDGDGVRLQCRLRAELPDAEALMDLLNGSFLLERAVHDPGAPGRPEGTDDYLVIPGLFGHTRELTVAAGDNSFLTASRELPEMDFVVECQNRLWGCRRGGGVNELYGSKLGDFRNWSVFSGLSTDSYRVSRGGGGAFTGAAVLGGCPLFFREDGLEKIYHAADGAHGVVTVSLCGIAPGSSRSAVVIRDRLYYKGRDGIYCYGGSLPTRISAPLGEQWLGNTVAGACGEAYYAAIDDEDGAARIFVYHTDTGLWQREDEAAFALTYPRGGRLYCLPGPGGRLFCIGEATDSDGVRWAFETGPLGPTLCTSRYLSRLQLEGRLALGAEMRVYLSYDDGPWVCEGSFRANRQRAELFPVYPRRCGSVRLRLEGAGGMELRAISWELEPGSDA